MDKVRIGVVGVGSMGSLHAKNMAKVPEAQLTCVCDIDEGALTASTAATGVPGYRDHRELIASGLADAVIVATPHWVHPEIAVNAMEAGLHVLSEKPIASSVSGADLMVKAAKRKKRVFAVMYQSRTEPAIRRAIELVSGGCLGELRRALCVDPCFRSQAYYDSATWRATWAGEGGGVTINQAPHTIDLFMKLGGMPSAVKARTRARLHDIEVEDEADAVLEYPNGSWGYYYTTTSEGQTGSVRVIEVVGELGKLRIYGDTVRLTRFSESITGRIRGAQDMWAANREEDVPLDAPEPGPIRAHMAVVQSFCRSILFGEPLVSPGVEGLMTVEFINALIWSGRTGKPVKLPVSRKRYDKFIAELIATSKVKDRVREQRVTDPNFTR